MGDPRRLALEGVALIEQAVVKLLDGAPDGLSNAEITRSLGLESDQNGKHKNYLAWSILGRMMKEGIVIQAAAPTAGRLVYKLPAD